MAVSPHQRRSSCLSVVHVRLSEKCSCFAAREISIRFSTCQLDKTMHAYPFSLGQILQKIHSAYFNALQYLHTNAAARASLLCMSAFSEKCSCFAAREISIRVSTCQLDTTKHAYPSLWANPFKYCTLHASMHCSISTPMPQLVPLSCAFPPFRTIF